MREREELKGWSQKELRLSTLAFKDDLQKGKKLESLIVPAFAVVCEAARRLYGKVPYEVQVLGGLVIHQGKIAEMKAGEGKTLTETMPVYLNALLGKGVHIITTNDYLAERDAREMGKLYDFLGLSTGYVTSQMKNVDRRKAYTSDITYVTNQEIGFDFLRDNLVMAKSDRVLRPLDPLHFGIVDEIDSILIDESRTPLIIAEPVKEEREMYDRFTGLVGELKEGEDFEVDYKHKQVSMTETGLNKAEAELGAAVFSKDNPRYVFYLDVCLKARVLFEKDRDYIVTKEGVEIVDEFTGRVLPGRRFTDGVHQAIESKEQVKVKGADRTVAAITFQNFFPMYQKLSGMSGTVMRARDEFNFVYHLDVVQIPTNRPVARIDHNDLFFKTERGKFLGLIKKVRQIHRRSQPLLIGTRNVETAHQVAAILTEENIAFQLLTASDHKAEAEKIAQAGQEGMVTIATNMAGRGTDILLGDGVEELGGLYVLGTERHESRRIDDQLVGRSGRQGELGESQFLISMEDEIMQLFGSEKIIDAMEGLDIAEDEYISGKSLDEAFKRAQDFVESRNYDSRIYLYKYDRVSNYQRNEVYQLREKLLENEAECERFLLQSVRDVLQGIFLLGDAKLICGQLREKFRIEIDPKELGGYLVAKKKNALPEINLEVRQKFENFLSDRVLQLKSQTEIWQACQNLVLEVIDSNWSRHLELTEILKEEANLLSYASEEPLIDYIIESRNLFAELGKNIQAEFIQSTFTYLAQKGLLEG
jgi:preprotein translocase subunit SecA